PPRFTMIHRVDDRLREEARRYRLVFACPDCVSFDPEGGGCSLGFPNEMHRDPSLEERSEVIFCKAFELA
ncbi:MAG: hypothetical protein ACMG6S_13445, partial [Byssovorax sp.]